MGILFVHELLCYTTFKTYYDKWSCRPLLSSAHVTPRWHIEDGRPTQHWTQHQHSGYKTGGLHYSSCAHSAFHITISGHQQKVIIHEDSNSSGHRPCTCSRKCKVLDSFSMQRNLDTGLVSNLFGLPQYLSKGRYYVDNFSYAWCGIMLTPMP